MSDGTDKECKQIYAITAAAAARAIASCRPSGPLQSTQTVDVSVTYSAQRHVLEVEGVFSQPLCIKAHLLKLLSVICTP